MLLRTRPDQPQVQHKTSWGELKTTDGWLDRGARLRVGVTSGASTPDGDVEAILDKVFTIMDPSFTGIERKFVGKAEKPAPDHDEPPPINLHE